MRHVANTFFRVHDVMQPEHISPGPLPRGVHGFDTAGACNYISFFDENSILKFPLVPADEEDVYTAKGMEFCRKVGKSVAESLEAGRHILQELGEHPRIAHSMGNTKMACCLNSFQTDR